MSKTSRHSQDLLRTLSMDNFLSILDLLDKVTKVHTSKAILTKFEEFKGTTSDPVIIHTLFDVAKNLHDSLDSMSFRDEVCLSHVLSVSPFFPPFFPIIFLLLILNNNIYYLFRSVRAQI